MTRLEQIEQQTGRLCTVADWHATLRKCADTPAATTDLDLAVIGHFSGARAERDATAARTAALAPPAVPPPAPPAPSEYVSKAQLSHLRKQVSVFAEALGGMLGERDKKIAELTATVREMSNAAIVSREELRALGEQVLELRADRAARTEVLP
jgi:hypothetical protein